MLSAALCSIREDQLFGGFVFARLFANALVMCSRFRLIFKTIITETTTCMNKVCSSLAKFSSNKTSQIKAAVLAVPVCCPCILPVAGL